MTSYLAEGTLPRLSYLMEVRDERWCLVSLDVLARQVSEESGLVKCTNRVVKEALIALRPSFPSQALKPCHKWYSHSNTSVYRSVMEQLTYSFQGHHINMLVGLTNRLAYNSRMRVRKKVKSWRKVHWYSSRQT